MEAMRAAFVDDSVKHSLSQRLNGAYSKIGD
jgi:hypothetical protein